MNIGLARQYENGKRRAYVEILEMLIGEVKYRDIDNKMTAFYREYTDALMSRIEECDDELHKLDETEKEEETNIKGLLYELLKEHKGHTVEIAEYGNGENFALEDVDTNEVIFDTDTYNLTEIE